MQVNGQTITPPQRVFITGANGFIGRSLARRYSDMGAQLGGIDFNADPEWGVVAGDLTRPEEWKKQLQGVDLVIHTAALVTNTATVDQAWRINVKGTRDLLAACVDAGVSRFVHLSSVATYGFDFPDGVTEDHPLRPMGNTYTDSKIASEHATLACHAAGRMDCTIVRPSDVYGPGSRPWVILPLEMIRKGKFLLPAHGKGVFSPVYVDDLINGIVLAAAQEAGRGQIYNIGGDRGVSCEQYFSCLAGMLGRSGSGRATGTRLAIAIVEAARIVTQLFGGKTELGRGVMDMLSRKGSYSIEKAGRELGYQPEVSLSQGMALTEEWAQAQGLLSR